MKPIDIERIEVNGQVSYRLVSDYDLSSLVGAPSLTWATVDEAKQARNDLRDLMQDVEDGSRGGMTDPPSGPVRPDRSIADL